MDTWWYRELLCFSRPVLRRAAVDSTQTEKEETEDSDHRIWDLGPNGEKDASFTQR